MTSGSQGTSFKVVVSNDSGSVTSEVAVQTLVPANQPVVVKDLSVAGFQGLPINIPLSALVQNARDPDGDPISLSSFDVTGSNTASLGTIEQSGATLVYSNSVSFAGSDRFNVVLTDGQEGDARCTSPPPTAGATTV